MLNNNRRNNKQSGSRNSPNPLDGVRRPSKTIHINKVNILILGNGARTPSETIQPAYLMHKLKQIRVVLYTPDRINDGPILSVMQPVTIDTILNNNGLNNGHRLNNVTRRQGFKSRVYCSLMTVHCSH